MADASMAMNFHNGNPPPTPPVREGLGVGISNLLTRWEMVQNRNRMVAAESSALIVLTMRATWLGSLANCEKRLAVSMKNGAPGGCPISSL